MRRHEFGFALAASALALSLVVAGCSRSDVSSGDSGNADMIRQQTVSESVVTGSEGDVTEDELAVLESYEAIQQAMVDKNVDAMRALTTGDKTFTHMSGKAQTREEFFGEIADGTLNYFGYAIHDPCVTIEGDRATLTGSTTLDAHVYGMSGSWTLPTNVHFIKQDGTWIQCN